MCFSIIRQLQPALKIQRFEYTYELCVKSLRRQLEELADSPAEIDALGYKDRLRGAVERGLIADAVPWFGFRELRNITSHAYDPDKATQVFNGIPAFLAGAQQLLARLAPQRTSIEWDAP